VRYNGRVHTTITPEAFPLFGRVTKGGKPVRATLAFSQHGSPVFATTDDDGRYEVLLRDQPDATINVTLCATHAELTHRATTRPVANSAFDIALPDAHVVVTVQDATTGASIAGARITGAASLEKEDEDTLHVLRATSDEKGKGEITTDPAWWWKICATNPATGYLEQACSGPLRLRDDESREVTLRLQKTGTVKARVLPLPHARGARLYHARAGTLLSTITIPADGEVWLREQPAPGDYFTYTSPAAPLSLIVQWAKDGETLVLTAPAATGVPLRITASDTARSGRLVGLRIQGVPVPSRALERHLMTRGINVTAPWPANAIVIPDVAAGGTVSVTLGPAQLPVGFPDNADLFAAANFASTYPTVEARNGAAVFP
jgi:hypothetical protein